MNIKEAVEKGLLIKDKQDDKKADQSIKVAKEKIKEAKKSFESDLFESTIIFSYMAMFHAARQLLFKEGFIEKSHYGLLVFIEEKYSNKIGSKLVYEFNTMRMSRHESLYGLDPDFTKEDAKYALDVANRFLDKIISF